MLETLGVVNIGVFVVGVVIIILTPGPNSLYVLGTAARRGVKDGCKAAAAVFIGDGVLMLLASLGVGSLTHLYPIAFLALQYLGAAYLGYLGFAVLCSVIHNQEGQSGKDAELCREDPFKRALILSLSNPKAIMFFVSFFVQFVDPAKGYPGLAFLILACIVQIVSMTYLSFLIFGGAKLARAVRGNRRLKRLGGAFSGFVFLGFGLRLAIRAGS